MFKRKRHRISQCNQNPKCKGSVDWTNQETPIENQYVGEQNVCENIPKMPKLYSPPMPNPPKLPPLTNLQLCDPHEILRLLPFQGNNRKTKYPIPLLRIYMDPMYDGHYDKEYMFLYWFTILNKRVLAEHKTLKNGSKWYHAKIESRVFAVIWFPSSTNLTPVRPKGSWGYRQWLPLLMVTNELQTNPKSAKKLSNLQLRMARRINLSLFPSHR